MENLLSEVFRIQKLMGIYNKNVLNEQGIAILLKSVIRGGSKTAVEALDDAAELLVSLGKITRAEADEAIRLIKAEKELMDYIDNSYVSSKITSTAEDVEVVEKFKTLAKKQGNKSLTKLLDEIAALTDDEIRVIANNVVRNMVKLNKFTNIIKGIENLRDSISTELKYFYEKTNKILKLKDLENMYDIVFHHYAKDFKKKYLTALKEELDNNLITKVEYDAYLKNADKDIQEFLFNHFKKRFKMSEQPEISSEIEKFRTSSRLDETTMDSLPVTYDKNPNSWDLKSDGLSPFKNPKSTELATDISKTTDEVDEIPITNPKIKIGNTSEETIFNFLGKGGMFRERTIKVIRELLDEILGDKQKLYINTLSPKELQDFKNVLGILKEKYGELKKIYVSNLEGTGNKTMTIDDFEKYIEAGYKRIYDSEGNFSPLNKLDTNYVDGPEQIIELMKKTLTKDEIDNFADIIKRLSMIPENDVLQKSLTMIELENKWSEIIIKLKNNSKDAVEKWYENVNEITKKIKSASLKGDTSEIKVTNLMESKGMKVLYTASEGNPVDSLLNIDHIVDDSSNMFGGGIKTVQTKSASYIIEGEFQLVTKTYKNGKTEKKWMFVEKPGTGKFKIGTTEKIGKQSQIDLSAFSDDAGNTIVCGRQKEWIGYDPNGSPIFSDKEVLPGSVSSSNRPFQIYIVDPETPKIVGKL